jgi:hypothetical protein
VTESARPKPSRARGRTGPINPATRTEVVELARGGKARNDIARQVGIGAASVTRICAAAGVSFDRAAVVQATVAKQADQAARRTRLAGILLDDLEGARSWLTQAEDSRALRDAASAIRSLADAHAKLATVATSDDDKVDHAKSLLGSLMISLQAAHGTGDDPAVAS